MQSVCDNCVEARRIFGALASRTRPADFRDVSTDSRWCQMSKLIPPLVCTTPPPIGGCSDLEHHSTEHDEFGDFATAGDEFYDCNSCKLVSKDFQDKRKEINVVVREEETNGYALDEDNDVVRPPALLFDDADNADVSDSPSNFSISFDDHVLDDDDDEDGSVEDDLELPNHEGAEAPRAEADDIDDEEIAKIEEQDFADFSSAPPADFDDDFDDFADYTSTTVLPSTTHTKITLLDAENAFTQAEIIFKTMFEASAGDGAQLDVAESSLTTTDVLFKQIQDVTDTNALSYQWGKSQVQQDMLKALCIDSRNILYAHGAIKADILLPTIVNPSTASVEGANAHTSSSEHSVVIPSAKFDWSEAGLANPFDSALGTSAPDTLMNFAPLPPALKSTPENGSTLEQQDWDVWLQSVSKEEDPTKQSSRSKDIASKVPVDTESVKSLQFAELQTDVDGEYSDGRRISYEDDVVETRLGPEGQSGSDDSTVDEFSDFTAFEHEKENAWPINNVVPLRETYIDAVKSDATRDDDFSDFQCSEQILTPTLLQPVRVQQPTEILWPAPGISDAELARFESYSADVTKLSGVSGSLMVEKSVVVPATKVILPFNEVLLPPNNQVVISKDLVLPILESSPRKYAPAALKTHNGDDDDDWSEFVSSTTTSQSVPNELPLSIPQLSSIQASKPPIPVITAQGLVQTKIPTLAPGTPTKCLTHVPLHVSPPTDGYQPATISEQFAVHLQNCLPPQQQQHDDDEWSDFMCSKPTNAPIVNGNATWTRHNPEMPNIIMNPVHFQHFAKRGKECKDTNGVLPDLAFVAPKDKLCNRTKK